MKDNKQEQQKYTFFEITNCQTSYQEGSITNSVRSNKDWDFISDNWSYLFPWLSEYKAGPLFDSRLMGWGLKQMVGEFVYLYTNLYPIFPVFTYY